MAQADLQNLEERIAEVEAVKRFCGEQGMHVGKMYTKMDLSRVDPGYSLYVSRRDKITVPENVRGLPRGWTSLDYSSEKAAMRRKKRLDKRFDTLLVPVAYGAEDCPITEGLLTVGLAERAVEVVHECFHVHAWHGRFDGGSACLPPCLEEPLATRLGFIGAREFLGERKPEELPAVEQQMAEWNIFVEFVNEYHSRLDWCYRRGGGEREAILAEAGEVARILGGECADPWVEDQYSHDINNAFFLAHRNYTAYYPAVRSLLEGLSLADYLGLQDGITVQLFDRCLGCGE